MSPLGEPALAAAALALLAQPRRWAALKLPRATPELAAKKPWTAYWSARLDPKLEPGAARAVHAAAWGAFNGREPLGALLALAALLETFYADEVALDPMDSWIERLAATLPPSWPSAEAEAQVIACGVAIMLRDQTHPLLDRWAERGPALLRELMPGPVRVRLATFLLQRHLWRGDFTAGSLVVDLLPGLQTEGLTPAEVLAWHHSVATHCRFVGEFARGRREVEAALTLARRLGLARHLYALHTHGAALALAAHDRGRAEAHVKALRDRLDDQAQADQTHYWHLNAGLALLRGEPDAAVTAARQALDNSLAIGGPYRTGAHRFSLGQALLVQGDPAAALEEFDAAARIAQRIDAALMAFSAALMRAAALQTLGRIDEAVAALRGALAEGARRHYRTHSGWWLPEVAAPLFALALERGIEPVFVRGWIQRYGLVAPDPQLADWPWPMALFGFGALSVLRDGHPVAPAGGADRSFDLLRALLALSPLPVATALQWLWPDSADPRKAFDVALSRLRRRLGDAKLLVLEGGRLAFAPGRVWTDATAFAALVEQVTAAQQPARPQLERWGQQLIALVRGPFLDGLDSPWASAARERCRQRFSLAAETIAVRLEAIDPAAARRWLRRAFDADPAGESIALALAQRLADAGERAEGERVVALAEAMRQLAGEAPLDPGAALRWMGPRAA